MSDLWWAVAIVVALALASLTVRRLLDAPRVVLGRRLALIGISAAFGVGVAVAIAGGWSHWPLGFVVGVAVVELGPLIPGLFVSARDWLLRKRDLG